jgi:hypothetical protein
MEHLNEIPNSIFYSFKDEHDIVYGFDMTSLLSAINKDYTFKNPYNREMLPISKFLVDISTISRLNAIFNLNDKREDKSVDDCLSNLSLNKQIQLRFLSICQKLDELGNYTDVNWFTSLSFIKIIKFFEYLKDIWIYRAQLNQETKLEIYPHGDPFGDQNFNIIANARIETLKIMMIKLIENFIYKGINRDAQFLGSSYILSALTLVNENAAQSMPWLYFSVANVD